MKSLRSHTRIRAGARTGLTASLFTLAIAGCASTPPSEPLALDARVRSTDGIVALHIAHEGWERSQVSPEPQPDREFLFELRDEDKGSILTAFRVIDSAPTLEDYVADRRTALLDSGAYDFREKRLFLGRNQDLVASIARYRQASVVFLVVTAIRTPTVVELMGITPRGHGAERELLDLMVSIEIGHPDEN